MDCFRGESGSLSVVLSQILCLFGVTVCESSLNVLICA